LVLTIKIGLGTQMESGFVGQEELKRMVDDSAIGAQLDRGNSRVSIDVNLPYDDRHKMNVQLEK